MAENVITAPLAGSSGILTIDLAALQHNYRVLAAHAHAHAHGAMAAAVIKADGYGLGAEALAPALYAAGCRLFFVAQPAEAFAVSKALAPPKKAAKAADKAVIALLNDVFPEEAAASAAAGFVPVLNSLESVREWAALCRAQKRALPAMLQCDSGMARLGLDSTEIKTLERQPHLLADMDIFALVSHLACGDAEQNPMNAAQKTRFLADAALISTLLPRKPLLSFAASAGMSLGAEFCLDIVRPGLALYGWVEGSARSQKLAASLRPVAALQARVLRVGRVRKGETIGYGAGYKAAKAMRVAAVSCGYADGWSRRLSNKGAVYYNGARLPIIGRISMDCMVVDLTPLIPAACPARGDWVELIGKQQTPHDIAADAGTIAYEVLTGLGRRFQRRYMPAAKNSGK